MTDSLSDIVVIGAGQAAGQLIKTLIKASTKTRITLIGDEPYQPYQRPPLSKKFLSGVINKESLALQGDDYFTDNNVNFLPNKRAVSIDRKLQTIALEDGDTVPYGKIALCTGTRARPLNIPGIDLQGVHSLRNISDVEAIKSQWENVKNLIVIGGGFIGLEVAAIAQNAGKKTTIVEMQDRLMPRVVAPIVSIFFQKEHERCGVTVRLGTVVDTIIGENGKVVAVKSGDETIAADMVIVGIGVLANDELAIAAGLECDSGVCVNEYAETSDPKIVSAGDCTRHHNPILNQRVRLESVQNATDQATIAAQTLLGQRNIYSKVPWFWSDQYEHKLQMAGLSNGYDDIVVRGDMDEAKFSLFYFHEDRLLAADSVNQAYDHMMSRKLLSTNSPLTKAQAADSSFNLKNAL